MALKKEGKLKECASIAAALLAVFMAGMLITVMAVGLLLLVFSACPELGALVAIGVFLVSVFAAKGSGSCRDSPTDERIVGLMRAQSERMQEQLNERWSRRGD